MKRQGNSHTSSRGLRCTRHESICGSSKQWVYLDRGLLYIVRIKPHAGLIHGRFCGVDTLTSFFILTQILPLGDSKLF